MNLEIILVIIGRYYTIIYFYRDKYNGLAPREMQYSPSKETEMNITF